MSAETANSPPPYVDDVTVRDLYVETVQVIALPQGAVRLEFCVNHYTPQAPIHIDRITPVARIAMHPALAMMLRDHLTQNLQAAADQAALAQAPVASPAKN
jgi:hypothetical protein